MRWAFEYNELTNDVVAYEKIEFLLIVQLENARYHWPKYPRGSC